MQLICRQLPLTKKLDTYLKTLTIGNARLWPLNWMEKRWGGHGSNLKIIFLLFQVENNAKAGSGCPRKNHQLSVSGSVCSTFMCERGGTVYSCVPQGADSPPPFLYAPWRKVVIIWISKMSPSFPLVQASDIAKPNQLYAGSVLAPMWTPPISVMLN